MYKPNPNIVFSENDDGTSIIVYGVGDAYFTMNQSATLIWKYLSEGQPIEAAVRALSDCAMGRVSEAQITEDVKGICEEFVNEKLLEVV